MKESKVNPMHDSPFYSSLAFPISTIVEAIILSTADTVWASVETGPLVAQSIHADYLSGLPGDVIVVGRERIPSAIYDYE